MVVPLDEQYLIVKNDKTGRDENFPALHPRWKEGIQFLLYQPPPLDPSDQASTEEWLERSTFIEEDLHTVLKLPHDKFWCQAVFDETLQRCVDSYLRHAPRSYDTVFQLGNEVLEKQNALHKRFFLVCLRMATHKESKDHLITPKVFGEILYENFLFDIPKLMDLCVLYGSGNGPLLSKMIGNIFAQQPKYEEDLRAVVPTVLEVLNTIQEKCGIKTDSAPGSPQKLNAPPSNEASLLTMSVIGFQDIVFYLSDTAQTLASFLDAYPNGASVFYDGDFLTRLASAYENLVMVLNEAIKNRDWSGTFIILIKRTLRQAQICMLRTFRNIIFQCCLQPILDNGDNLDTHIEGYLQVMSNIMMERRFLAHYETLYPFHEDRDLIIQSAYTIDETRLQFIADDIAEAYAVFGKKRQNANHLADTSGSSGTSANGTEEAASSGARAGAVVGASGATPPQVTVVELESLICSVQDLLPDLGPGFIEICLEEFNYDSEAAINAILEDNLPPSLEHLDRKMERDLSRVYPEETEEAEDDTLVGQRKNIFDNDEFDVFHHDKVDMSKIHKGKKEKNTEGMKLLDDKTSLAGLKPLYQKYGSEFTESLYEPPPGEYEDEYDDTYDSNEVGAADADSADELLARRVFTIPRILGGAAQKEDEDTPASEDVSDDEGHGEGQGQRQGHSRGRRDDFVEDPALIRERNAQRYAQRQATRGRGRGQGQGQAQGRDLKGGPKGQGQSADVVRNRTHKEKTKSTRVHHNRKVLADKKRKI